MVVFMRHYIFKICLGLGSVLLTVPVSFATVGGKSYIELLGYEAKDQKLYLLKHNEDASGRLPQLYYFDFKSAQPEQLIEVKSIYPRTKTGEIDYFSDGTDVPFERELKKITRRLKKLYPINPNIFKINVGMAPLHYLERQRIEAAKSLLLATNYTIYAIAEQVGFNNPYHFSTRFRRCVGISPRVFRDQTMRPNKA